MTAIHQGIFTVVVVNAAISACAAVPQHQQHYRTAGLGPGSFEPKEWASYPRGPEILDEVCATVSNACSEGVRRCRVCLGLKDLEFLEKEDEEESVLSAAVEMASRWQNGPAAYVLTGSRASAKAATEMIGCHNVVVDTLADVAKRVEDGKPLAVPEESLVVLTCPSSQRGTSNAVAQLQIVAARLHHAYLVIFNPRLYVPSPVAPGRTMQPMIASDFVPVYVAEADALDATAMDDDSGLALYLRWPHPSWRLFERRRTHYAFVGSAAQRPTDSQLRAVYRAATQETHFDGIDI